MDIAIAARMSLDHIGRHPQARWPDHESLGLGHVRDMLRRVADGEITGEKAHRWLGWARQQRSPLEPGRWMR